ncbi:hypothetical protein EVAR_50034_1 [Eumeta japonica]|uniref:Uncharacterized protein n=1 Tax=Eumeta variegata TaxID=151549 RepID=A0A4C1XI42_EUMVA|nr:hypothetical protein EVAR_50034_1 [Eumeta japonica]
MKASEQIDDDGGIHLQLGRPKICMWIFNRFYINAIVNVSARFTTTFIATRNLKEFSVIKYNYTYNSPKENSTYSRKIHGRVHDTTFFFSQKVRTASHNSSSLITFQCSLTIDSQDTCKPIVTVVEPCCGLVG